MMIYNCTGEKIMITLKYLRDQRTASKSLNDGEMHKQSQMKTMKHHRAYPQQAQINLSAGTPVCNSWSSSIAVTFWGLAGRLTPGKHGGKHTATHSPAWEIWESHFL